MWDFVIEVIRSIFLLIASILIIIAAYGVLKLDDEMDKVLYVRVHILGMFDIAFIIALLGLNQIFIAGFYFIIAPFIAHAIAHAYYHGEDENKEDNDKFYIGNTIDNNQTNDKIKENTHD